MCGEKPAHAQKLSHCEGSPPRVRGKVCVSARGLLLDRITPACAGKRFFAPLGGWKNGGSPPRVRGKVLPLYVVSGIMRITPACAGKSIINQTIHYHTCGSPPRMRGKEEFACSDGSQVGITPAYAGKSREVVCHVCVVTDHPRVCGEKAFPVHWKKGL